MLIKQIQLFQLNNSKNYLFDTLLEQINLLPFQPCLLSLPASTGWISPIDDDNAPLMEQMNGRIMLCMQIEERILPSTVVNQTLKEKLKHLQVEKNRKLSKKERQSLKEEIILTLLPRTFTKLTRIYAYLDIKNYWLVLGTVNKKRTEQFLNLFKKTFNESMSAFEIKKISPIITQWIKNKDYPDSFTIEKKCVLQDANQKTRIIRCQQQDLFVNSIHEFIKDGCELKQVEIKWQNYVNFVFTDDFTLRSIKFEDELIDQVKAMEAETPHQKFMADFFMMTETFSSLFKDLLGLFVKIEQAPKASALMI